MFEVMSLGKKCFVFSAFCCLLLIWYTPISNAELINESSSNITSNASSDSPLGNTTSSFNATDAASSKSNATAEDPPKDEPKKDEDDGKKETSKEKSASLKEEDVKNVTAKATKAAEKAISKVSKALKGSKVKKGHSKSKSKKFSGHAKDEKKKEEKKKKGSSHKKEDKKQNYIGDDYETSHTSTTYDMDDDPYDPHFHPDTSESYGDGDYRGEEDYESSYNNSPNSEEGNYNEHRQHRINNNAAALEAQLYEYKNFPNLNPSAEAFPPNVNPLQQVAGGQNFQAQSIATLGQGGIGPEIVGPDQGSFGNQLRPSVNALESGQAAYGGAGNIGAATLGQTELTQDEYRQLEDGVPPVIQNVNRIVNPQEEVAPPSYAKKTRTHQHRSKGRRSSRTKKLSDAVRVKHSQIIDSPYKRTIMLGNRVCGSKKGVKRPEDDVPSGFRATDTCCNEHNECQRIVPAKSTKYGYQNELEYDVMSCACDAKFRSCLKNTNSYTADAVGHLYFNTLKIPCLTFEQAEPPPAKTEQPSDISNLISVLPDTDADHETLGRAQVVMSSKVGTNQQLSKETAAGKEAVKEPVETKNVLKEVTKEPEVKNTEKPKEVLKDSTTNEVHTDVVNVKPVLELLHNSDRGGDNKFHQQHQQAETSGRENAAEFDRLEKEIAQQQKEVEQNRLLKERLKEADQMNSQLLKEFDHLQKEQMAMKEQQQKEQATKEQVKDQGFVNYPNPLIKEQNAIKDQLKQRSEEGKKRPNIMNPNPNPNPHTPPYYTGKLRGIVTLPEAYYPKTNF